ncbi:MAG: hypothetical protein GX675_01240 [Erysipelotrichaceae bacterium]|nr:hypothetical protein [Erysipelotrichaceae bacterium]
MTANKNEVVTQSIKAKAFGNALASAQETYINLISESVGTMNLALTDYQKLCGMNVISKMKELADKEGLPISKMNQTNIMSILQQVTMLNLNITASPRECYMILRNVKIGDTWTKEFEFGIEGDGNDKLLRTYGVDIEKVHPYWVVRENDEFTYPAFKGLEIDPPTWIPKDYQSKVVRVVYPIQMQDGSVQYHIAEREGVKSNLLGHINNNLMKNKEYTDIKKKEVIARLDKLELDKIFEDEEALKIMSSSWSSPHSREAMILRKLRNNCIKKIPKDFTNSFVASTYEKTFEDYDQYEGQTDSRINKEEALEAEIMENVGTEQITLNTPIDVETGEILEEVNIKEVSDVKAAKKRPF